MSGLRFERDRPCSQHLEALSPVPVPILYATHTAITSASISSASSLGFCPPGFPPPSVAYMAAVLPDARRSPHTAPLQTASFQACDIEPRGQLSTRGVLDFTATLIYYCALCVGNESGLLSAASAPRPDVSSEGFLRTSSPTDTLCVSFLLPSQTAMFSVLPFQLKFE